MFQLPEPEPTRKRKTPRYEMQPEDKAALNELKRLALESIRTTHPNVPYPESFVHKYIPNTANGLQYCIIDWLEFDGQQGEPIKVKGTMVDNTKVVTDVLGSRRIVGSVDWTKSTMTKGSADISATIEGRSIKIEIKINTDRQSQNQKEYQQSIERAKGVYVIIKTLGGWAEWYSRYKASLTTQTELFTNPK